MCNCNAKNRTHNLLGFSGRISINRITKNNVYWISIPFLPFVCIHSAISFVMCLNLWVNFFFYFGVPFYFQSLNILFIFSLPLCLSVCLLFFLLHLVYVVWNWQHIVRAEIVKYPEEENQPASSSQSKICSVQ
jgi:Trk-type K+ transport system membrane component